MVSFGDDIDGFSPIDGGIGYQQTVVIWRTAKLSDEGDQFQG